MRVTVVLIHHDVDGGYREARLFANFAAAERWLRANEYRPSHADPNNWEKPVDGEWDSEEYRTHPEHFEMETAEVSEQEVIE